MLPYADGARKTATRSPPLAPSRNVNTEKTPSIPDSRPRNKFRVKRKTHRNRSTKKHKQTNAATYWLLRGSPKRATESAVHRRKWLRSIVESGPHPGHLKKKYQSTKRTWSYIETEDVENCDQVQAFAIIYLALSSSYFANPFKLNTDLHACTLWQCNAKKYSRISPEYFKSVAMREGSKDITETKECV